MGVLSDAGDIYHWQALTLIRQHISLALMRGEGRKSQDGGFALYRKIHTGNFLPRKGPEWEAYLSHFPMSVKALQVFEERMLSIKQELKEVTAPLMISHAQPLPAGTPALLYLTVGTVDEADFPWIKEASVETPGPSSRRAALRSRASAVAGPSTSRKVLGKDGSSPKDVSVSTPRKPLPSGRPIAPQAASPGPSSSGITPDVPSSTAEKSPEPRKRKYHADPAKLSEQMALDTTGPAAKIVYGTAYETSSTRTILKPSLKKVAGASSSGLLLEPSASNDSGSTAAKSSPEPSRNDSGAPRVRLHLVHTKNSPPRSSPGQSSTNKIGSTSSDVTGPGQSSTKKTGSTSSNVTDPGQSSTKKTGSMSSNATAGPSRRDRGESVSPPAQVASGPSRKAIGKSVSSPAQVTAGPSRNARGESAPSPVQVTSGPSRKASGKSVSSPAQVTAGPSRNAGGESASSSTQVASGPSATEYDPESPPAAPGSDPKAALFNHINASVTEYIAKRASESKKRKADEALHSDDVGAVVAEDPDKSKGAVDPDETEVADDSDGGDDESESS